MKKVALLFTLLIGVFLGSYALFIEPKQIKTTEYNITTQKWSVGKELRIVLIADIHAIWPWTTPTHIRHIVRMSNDLKPDLVLLLGDYVGTHPFGLQVPPSEGIAPLIGLKAECGVFAVQGNHDFDPPGWLAALHASPINLLENNSQKISCKDQSFWVSGLKDKWHADGNVSESLKSVTDDAPIIIAMHNPDSFVDVPQHVALTTAGHMHNGQVHIPFIGAVKAVLPSKYGKRFLYGHIQEQGKDMIVSAGLGMTGLPIRFMAPPEITVVTLTGK